MILLTGIRKIKNNIKLKNKNNNTSLVTQSTLFKLCIAMILITTAENCSKRRVEWNKERKACYFNVFSVRLLQVEQRCINENVWSPECNHLNASDDVCSSWTLAQVDNWKHRISDKYIIVFLLLCFFLPYETRSEQNELFLFIIDKLSPSIL